MPPTRRRTASPNAQDLAGLRETPVAGGRLRKAPAADPVLGVASAPSSAESPAQAEPAAAGQRAPSRRSTTSSSAAAAAKSKVGFYQSPDDTARARAAFTWTRPQEGHRSFSDFVAHALMREVERLETEYHGGRAWPPMEPGELPTGKPLGA